MKAPVGKLAVIPKMLNVFTDTYNVFATQLQKIATTSSTSQPFSSSNQKSSEETGIMFKIKLILIVVLTFICIYSQAK